MTDAIVTKVTYNALLIPMCTHMSKVSMYKYVAIHFVFSLIFTLIFCAHVVFSHICNFFWVPGTLEKIETKASIIVNYTDWA